MFSTEPDKKFTEADVAVLSLFAKHAAIAITNARLHADAADRARRLAVAEERERVVRDVHDTVARALGSILVHLDGERVRDRGGPARSRTNGCPPALAETRRTALGLVPTLLEHRALRRRARHRAGLGEVDRRICTPTWSSPARRREIAPEVSTAGAADGPGGTDQRRRPRRGAAGAGRRHLRVRRRRGRRRGRRRRLRRRRPEGEPRGPASGSTASSRAPTSSAADLEIESDPGWGTRVRATVPYDGSLLADRAQRGSARGACSSSTPPPVVRAGLVRLLGERRAPDPGRRRDR